MTVWLQGLATLAEHYDGFVLDQFGVLHDGQRPYPGVAEALRQLRATGKHVMVLSNSGKRAAHNAERLARFGVTPDLYDSVLSSGEVTWQMLQRRDRAPWSALGTRVLLLNPADDAPMIDGLTLHPVAGVAQADFMLIASLPDAMRPHDRHGLLAQAVARGLMLVCANPDRERLTPRGNEPSSGALAALYEALGGAVVWVGKPYPLIYAACHERLQALGARRICAVGDSLEHDIQGGAGAGFDTCFIAGGLHGAAFEALDARATSTPRVRTAASADARPLTREQLLADLLASPESHGAPAPTWALDTLRW